MKIFLNICLLLVTILFYDCSVCSCKKVPCPGFIDNNFSAWFPYSIGQSIVFQNNSLFDTISFSNIDKSTSYEANKGCYNGNSGCDAHCYIYSDEIFTPTNRKFQVVINMTTPFGSSSPQKNIFFNLYGFNCQATDVGDTGLIHPTIPSKYYTSLSLGSSVYNNVQLIQKDTSGGGNYSGPYKIFIVKNQGVVAFENYPDLKTWFKQ